MMYADAVCERNPEGEDNLYKTVRLAKAHTESKHAHTIIVLQMSTSYLRREEENFQTRSLTLGWLLAWGSGFEIVHFLNAFILTFI